VFAVGLFFFTTHYLVLRGFYALEQNRRVFFIQCVVSATNVVAAVALTRGASDTQTAVRLVVAYTLSYAVGAAVSYGRLAREVGGLDSATTVRFAVRMAIAVGVCTAAAWALHHVLLTAVPGDDKASTVLVLAVTGLVDGGIFLLLARLMRISEVTDVFGVLARRLNRGRASSPTG
jgi:putative peptidoglycan lipid II flippase